MLNITFTQAELNALSALLDAAVKATGIQGAKAALPLVDKLERAVADANAAAQQAALQQAQEAAQKKEVE